MWRQMPEERSDEMKGFTSNGILLGIGDKRDGWKVHGSTKMCYSVAVNDLHHESIINHEANLKSNEGRSTETTTATGQSFRQEQINDQNG